MSRFGTLADALVDDSFWNDKFVAYLKAHSERIQYFLLTTFEQFLIVPISENVRRVIYDDAAYADAASRRDVLRDAKLINLRNPGSDADLVAWCKAHLSVATIRPPKLSSITDLRILNGSDDLEQFASSLADIVIGPEGATSSPGTLAASVQVQTSGFADLPGEMRRSLIIYTMSAHGGMSLQDAEQHLARISHTG